MQQRVLREHPDSLLSVSRRARAIIGSHHFCHNDWLPAVYEAQPLFLRLPTDEDGMARWAQRHGRGT